MYRCVWLYVHVWFCFCIVYVCAICAYLLCVLFCVHVIVFLCTCMRVYACCTEGSSPAPLGMLIPAPQFYDWGSPRRRRHSTLGPSSILEGFLTSGSCALLALTLAAKPPSHGGRESGRCAESLRLQRFIEKIVGSFRRWFSANISTARRRPDPVPPQSSRSQPLLRCEHAGSVCASECGAGAHPAPRGHSLPSVVGLAKTATR